MQFPVVVTTALSIPFFAANVATASYASLTTGAGNLLRAHGNQSQQEKYLIPMLEGRFFGTMNLSEPQAGSSLGDIRTKATPSADGSGKYLIEGTKMWISGGDHEMSENIIHLVLAKVQRQGKAGGSGGVKDISLFIVPKYKVDDEGNLGLRNDVQLAGVNHKMGWRGTINTVMSFGEQGSCIGEIVGEEGKGLAYMFHMMNEARLMVGTTAASLGSAGYAYSLAYARERVQGRALKSRDVSSPQIPIICHSDVKRMLLAQKAYSEGAIALCLYVGALIDIQKSSNSAEQAEAARLKLEILTPIVKSWPSEWCLSANNLAIQVLGGYGYTRDYPVEQFYRDNRLNMIHEGTNGIQSIDLLGRKVSMEGGAALKELLDAIIETTTAAKQTAAEGNDSHGNLLRGLSQDLESAINRLIECVSTLLEIGGKGDVDTMLANSHEFLNMFGHTVIAWIWLKQAIVAASGIRSPSVSNADKIFYEGKLTACKWFFKHELPKTEYQATLLKSLDTANRDANEQCL